MDPDTALVVRLEHANRLRSGSRNRLTAHLLFWQSFRWTMMENPPGPTTTTRDFASNPISLFPWAQLIPEDVMESISSLGYLRFEAFLYRMNSNPDAA
jgi:hypothetical protein